MCDFIDLENPERAEVPCLGSPNYERMTDYAVNVQFILCCLASGDGGKEAERILGFLGLPNSTTMGKRSFPLIEARLGPMIQSLTDEILLDNLIFAVEKSYSSSGYARVSFPTYAL
jgi:hypothetical protein